jgi:UDP-glucose 4-epimerase
MRLLITGGAGTLGAAIIDRLLDRPGVQILALDNFATGSRGNLPPSATGFELREGSVADKAFVESAFSDFKPTHVIHSAAAYKDPDDWASDAETNVLGSIHVAKAALAAGVKRLVNFQTALCYGRPDSAPIPSDAPTRPFTSYGMTKTAGEQVFLMSGLNVISLRLSNITGPRLAIGPIPTFYQRLKAGKACFCSDTVRDFMDQDDFLDFLELTLDEAAPQGVFNVSTGEGKTIKDVFDVVADHLGVTPEPPPITPPGPDDVQVVVLDPSATEAAFGWKAKVPFEETMRKMLRWYDAHGVLAVYAHLKAPPQTTGA